MDAGILSYRRAQQSPPYRWTEKASWLICGAVSFCSVTLLIFIAATLLRQPDLLTLYPAAFIFALCCTASESPLPRFLGLGAVLGSVVLSTVGYTICLLWMSRV